MPNMWLGLTLVLCTVSAAIAQSPALSIAEGDCLAKSQLYHAPTNQCYGLLQRGPCAKGEWFVLRQPLADEPEIVIKGECQMDKCNGKGFYWPDTKKCVTSEDKNSLCGGSDTVELGNNNFGEGECVCDKNSPRVWFRERCAELYQRGPCTKGNIVAYRKVDSEEPECLPDPCFAESRDKKASGEILYNQTLALYNGSCYPLDARGPCNEKMVFKASVIRKRVDCLSLTHAIFSLAKPGESSSEYRPPPPDDNSYKEQLFAAINCKRRQQQGKKRREEVDIVLEEVIEEDEYGGNA